MQCFMQRRQQLDLIKPYFGKFYEELPKIVATRDREFSEIFSMNLSPAFMARDEDFSKFKSILEGADPEKDFFVQFCKKQIETIEVAQKARRLCEGKEASSSEHSVNMGNLFD